MIMNHIMSSTVGKTALKYYDEPHRHYHNADHITGMFKLAENLKLELSLAQELAILFHDIVYIPGYASNEEASAQLMTTLMHDIVHPDTLEDANIIILNTRGHTCLPHEEAVSACVLDLDLADLGASWKVFSKNTELIRAEYRVATDEEFCNGRIGFLTGMLNRSYIYYTHIFRQKYEVIARQNMEKELYIFRKSRWTATKLKVLKSPDVSTKVRD